MLKAAPADNGWIFSNASPWTWRRRYCVPFAPCWIDLLRFAGLHQRSSGPANKVLCGLLKVILAISNILKFFVLVSSAPLPIPCPTVVLGCDNLFWCCVRPDPLHSLHVMPQAQVMLNAVAKSSGSKIGSIKPEQVICWITLLKLCFLDEIFTNIFEMFRS